MKNVVNFLGDTIIYINTKTNKTEIKYRCWVEIEGGIKGFWSKQEHCQSCLEDKDYYGACCCKHDEEFKSKYKTN